MPKSRVCINTNFSSYINFFLTILSKKDLKLNFLNKLKIFLKKKNLILVSQGRVAIHLVAKNLIKGKKNIFLTSPYTLNEALNAIKYAGGKIEFVDIDIKTGLPDIKKLKSKITTNTCAILITHLYSSKKNIEKFFKTFKNQTVIEDTAINFGAKVGENYLGTLSDFGCFSFGTMKNLCLFNGGLIFCKKNKDYNKIKLLEKKLFKYPLFEFIKKMLLALIIDCAYNKIIYSYFTHYVLNFVYKYNIKTVIKIIYPGLFPRQSLTAPKNYKYKFQNFVSKNGINLLKDIKKEHYMRISKAKLYNKYLINNHLFEKLIFDNEFKENSFLEYPILCKKKSKMNLVKELFKNGYDVRYKWYIDNSKFFTNKKFKNSNYLEKNILCLPTNKNFNHDDIKRISYVLNNYNHVK